MRCNLRLVSLSVFFLFLCTTTYPTNYYVDKYANGSNNGTSWANAWQSFSVINWGSINPGDYIFISGGTDSTIYYEEMDIPATVKGTAINPITIIAGKYAPNPTGHNGRVIIDGGDYPSAGSRPYSIYINLNSYSSATEYVTLKGFELRGGKAGLKIEGYSERIIIDSMTVTHYYDVAGIWVMGQGYGNSFSGCDSTIIQNCTIISDVNWGNQTDCIYVGGATNTIIRNNYIHQRSQNPTAHTDGIQSIYCQGWEIYNNIIISDSVYSPTGGGMPFIVRDGDMSGNHLPVIVYNNFMYMGGVWMAGANWGIVMNTHSGDQCCAPQPPCYIFNNTIIGNGPQLNGVSLDYFVSGIFENNIVAQYGAGTPGTWLTTVGNSSGTAIDVDSAKGNLFWRQWGSGGDPDIYGSWTNGSQSISGHSGWSDWINIGGTGINENPLLVNNIGHEPDQGALRGNLQEDSPAINAGTDLTYLKSMIYNLYGITIDIEHDINGNVRNTTHPSMGAYEYTNGGGGGNNPPNQPSNPNPVNGSINQPVNLTLTWSCTDPEGDPLTYDVYFGTNNNPPLASSNQSNTSYNPGQLNNNTTYYWKIVAKDNQGASTAGPLWNFSTISVGGNNPPNQPSNPNPVNGSINQPVNLTLTWSCTDPDGDPLTYDVYFGTNNNPPLVSGNQSNASYDPGQLNNSTTYYWKIVASDNQGASTSGPLWNFSTEAGSDITPPELIGVQIVEPTQVALDFSEPIDGSQVGNLGNYIISEQIQVLDAELNATQQRIILTTDQHIINHIYTITIHNLTDLAGNVIFSEANSAFYKELDLGYTGYIEHLIENVDASATTDTNTSPQKTLDGLINSDPDPNSRWAAEIMPQWIQYDLGAVENINLIAISFYRWNYGRVYVYSIQVSDDLNNWNEIVSSASSSSQEWTFNEFNNLTARYVRIVCLSNNEADWAGLWEARIFEPDYPTISNENIKPQTYSLEQNYPNPFNPTTTIQYSIPERSMVKLLIYNFIGQEIAVLVNEEKEVGVYSTEFNAANLTSGIYIYKLQTENFTEIRKMILMK